MAYPVSELVPTVLSTSNTSTPVTLLRRAQAGSDSPAWEEVLRYYQPFVRRILVRMKIKSSEIDDVCQMVLAKLWRDLKNYKRDEKRARFRSWLTSLIRSVAIDDYRKRMRVKRTENFGADVISNVAVPCSELEDIVETEWQYHVTAIAMSRVQNAFTGKAIEVFVRIKKGESYEKVSQELGITKQSAQVLKSRVTKRLMFEVAQIRKSLELPR